MLRPAQTFMRSLAVKHGLTSDEYLAPRTAAEWEKQMVSTLLRRLVGSLTSSMLTLSPYHDFPQATVTQCEGPLQALCNSPKLQVDKLYRMVSVAEIMHARPTI